MSPHVEGREFPGRAYAADLETPAPNYGFPWWATSHLRSWVYVIGERSMGRTSFQASLSGTPSLHATEYADPAADRALAESSRFAAGGRGMHGTRAPLPKLVPSMGNLSHTGRTAVGAKRRCA